MLRSVIIAILLGFGLGGAILALIIRGQDVPDPSLLITVPSGQPITFAEVITGERGPGGLTLRYRFIAPQIERDGGSVNFDQASEDMHHLCETYAIPRIANTGPQPSQIIISLADRPVEFGAPAPAATQYFEAYRVSDKQCIWESF